MVGRRNSMLAVMAGAAFALQAGLATGAAAQGNTQLAVAPRVFKSFSIADMQSMMEELGFTILAMGAAQDPNSGELAAVMQVQVPSGGVFLATARNCGGANFSGCDILQYSIFFNAMGLTLAQLNDFHLSAAGVSTGGLMADNVGVLGVKRYTGGGVTKEYLIYTLAIFFADLENFFTAISPGTIAEVNYGRASAAETSAALHEAAIAHGFALPAGAERVVNAVGVNTPKFLNEYLEGVLKKDIE